MTLSEQHHTLAELERELANEEWLFATSNVDSHANEARLHQLIALRHEQLAERLEAQARLQQE